MLAPAPLDLGQDAPELGGEGLVMLLPGLELGAAGFHMARENGHGAVTLKGVPAKGKGSEMAPSPLQNGDPGADPFPACLSPGKTRAGRRRRGCEPAPCPALPTSGSRGGCSDSPSSSSSRSRAPSRRSTSG